MRRLAALVLPGIAAAAPLAAQDQWEWLPGDTASYANPETARVITLARARHYYRDSLISNYTALTHTRFDAGLGRRRFIRIPPFAAAETAARVQWQDPGDLRIEILGERNATRIDGLEIDALFDRPWFVPRAIGDSIALLGGDFPENPALHPLSEAGARFYRYAIFDSLSMSVPGRTLRAVAVRVEPRVVGPALIAGDMWLDADTYEVVRLTAVFLGTHLWELPDSDSPEDSASAARTNQFANRVLTARADLEYGLFENRYWLPHRQSVTLDVELPWILDVKVPIRFITTFSDYVVNQPSQIEFEVPLDSLIVDDEWRTVTRCPDCDSLATDRGVVMSSGALATDSLLAERGYTRAGGGVGGRWELVFRPADSLRSWPWDAPLALDFSAEDERQLRETSASLERLSESLPDELTGRTRGEIAWTEVADIARFNRVQGLSVGAGYLWRPGPAFTSVYLSGRIGTGDLRPMGNASLTRDDPSRRIEIRLYRDLTDVDPWTRGPSIGNSLNAFLAGHDDADYQLVLGASATLAPHDLAWSVGLDELELTLGVERQRSVLRDAGSAFENIWDDGVLATNPPVSEGDYVLGHIRASRHLGWSRIDVGADILRSGTVTGGRVWTAVHARIRAAGRTSALTVRAGAAGTRLAQHLFRLGGPYTVRGHDYGSRYTSDIWSAQLDVPLKGSGVAPVIFADVADDFGLRDPMVGVGLGISLINGWIRPNLSYGIRPDAGFRFDLLFGAPR